MSERTVPMTPIVCVPCSHTPSLPRATLRRCRPCVADRQAMSPTWNQRGCISQLPHHQDGLQRDGLAGDPARLQGARPGWRRHTNRLRYRGSVTWWLEKALTQQIQLGAAEHLALEHLEAIDVAFYRAVAPRQGDASLDGIIIFPQPFRKALKRIRQTCGGALQPWL